MMNKQLIWQQMLIFWYVLHSGMGSCIGKKKQANLEVWNQKKKKAEQLIRLRKLQSFLPKRKEQGNSCLVNFAENDRFQRKQCIKIQILKGQIVTNQLQDLQYVNNLRKPIFNGSRTNFAQNRILRKKSC
jgi:hypothetical protein